MIATNNELPYTKAQYPLLLVGALRAVQVIPSELVMNCGVVVAVLTATKILFPNTTVVHPLEFGAVREVQATVAPPALDTSSASRKRTIILAEKLARLWKYVNNKQLNLFRRIFETERCSGKQTIRVSQRGIYKKSKAERERLNCESHIQL